MKDIHVCHQQFASTHVVTFNQRFYFLIDNAGGWTHWVCDSKAAFDWRYVDRSQSIVDLKLEGDGLIRHLNREPATDGQSYTDGLVAFHIRGDQGLVYWIANNDLIGRGCRTP